MHCQPPRHFRQHLIASRMTERSDDALELLNLNEISGDRLILELRSNQQFIEDLRNSLAGRQPGQAVVVGLVPNGRFPIGNGGSHGIECAREPLEFGRARRRDVD